MNENKNLIIAKKIIKLLYAENEDYKALAILMNEEADGINVFIKANIKELKEICEKALEELEQ